LAFPCRTGLTRLTRALNTDLDWLREHTRLLQRATEWEAGDRPENRLLSGGDIATAKAWAARWPKDEPEPTPLHLDFIRTSEEAEASRHNAERRRCERPAQASEARVFPPPVGTESVKSPGRSRTLLITARSISARVRLISLSAVNPDICWAMRRAS
jgi:hypothetical protein